LPNGEKHQRELLLEPPTGRGDRVDLRSDPARIRRIGVQQRLQLELLRLEIGAQIDQPEAVLHVRLLDTADLGLRKLQALDDLGILPPGSQPA
jgi:hypothetical protein